MSKRRGSTLVEFVFVLPIGVALLVGGLSIGTASLRSVQAGQYAKDISLIADAGVVDLGGPAGQRQIVELGKGLGLANGQAAVYITKVVREPAGFRVDRSYQMGATSRWAPGLLRAEDAAELEPGESAWVVEVFAESGTMISSLVPETVKARSVL